MLTFKVINSTYKPGERSCIHMQCRYAVFLLGLLHISLIFGQDPTEGVRLLARSGAEVVSKTQGKLEDCDGDSGEIRVEKRKRLLALSSSQVTQSKNNISRGESWEFPVKLGDTRDVVYGRLGRPNGAANLRVKQLVPGPDDTQYWEEEGISIHFEDNKVLSIRVAAGDTSFGKEYEKPVAYGVRSGDTLSSLYSKLGMPYSPTVEGDSKWGGAKDIRMAYRRSPDFADYCDKVFNGKR
jgi:hypothetical protein